MLTVIFIILGMFACSGIAIRIFKDLCRKDFCKPQLIWHATEMVVLITFLSFLVVR